MSCRFGVARAGFWIEAGAPILAPGTAVLEVGDLVGQPEMLLLDEAHDRVEVLRIRCLEGPSQLGVALPVEAIHMAGVTTGMRPTAAT